MAGGEPQATDLVDACRASRAVGEIGEPIARPLHAMGERVPCRRRSKPTQPFYVEYEDE
jgi:hypothetical protein